MKWLRLYTEIRQDHKLRCLKYSERWLWIMMLCLAAESPVPGVLLLGNGEPITAKMLTKEMMEADVKWRLAKTKKALKTFQFMGMISQLTDERMAELGTKLGTELGTRSGTGSVQDQVQNAYSVDNWHKRQYEWDSSTARVRKYREKHRFSNVPVTHQNTDIQIKEESKEAQAPVTPPPAETPKKRKPETRPAVEIYHRLTNLFPAKAWWSILDESVSDDPDALVFWSRVVKGWLGMGWKPTSVKLMLDYFKKRQVPGERGNAWIPTATPQALPCSVEQAGANLTRLSEMFAQVAAAKGMD